MSQKSKPKIEIVKVGVRWEVFSDMAWIHSNKKTTRAQLFKGQLALILG